MNGNEALNCMAVLAAGAIAGGVATTPEEAAKFAAECLKRLREEQRADYRGDGGRVA